MGPRKSLLPSLSCKTFMSVRPALSPISNNLLFLFPLLLPPQLEESIFAIISHCFCLFLLNFIPGPGQLCSPGIFLAFGEHHLTYASQVALPLSFPHSSIGKESTCNAGDPSSIPGLGRSPWRRDRLPTPVFLGFPCQLVKNLPAMLETWVLSLGWEDTQEKGMATHSSILAWRIPFTE